MVPAPLLRFLLSSLNKVNVPLFLLHLLSGTLCLLTFALVLKLISFLHSEFIFQTGFLANGLHMFDPPWQFDMWLDCVGGMVLLVLAAKASPTLCLSNCEMDDKPGLID